MTRFMPILGFCADAFRAGLAVYIDLKPLGLKIDRKEGEIRGTKNLKYKFLHFHNINNFYVVMFKYTDHIYSKK